MNARVIQYRHVEATRPIWMPDGITDGQALRLRPLREKLGHIMPIDPSWGKSKILDEWENLCLERAQAIAGASWRGATEGLLKQAAAEIGSGA